MRGVTWPRELGGTVFELRPAGCRRQSPPQPCWSGPAEGRFRAAGQGGPYAEVWTAAGSRLCSVWLSAYVQLQGAGGRGSSWAESVMGSLLLRGQLATTLSALADGLDGPDLGRQHGSWKGVVQGSGGFRSQV